MIGHTIGFCLQTQMLFRELINASIVETSSLKTIMVVLQFENSYLPPTGLVIELTDVELCFIGKSAHGSRVVNRS